MNGGLANYRPYPTADGKFVFFGPIEPHLLSRFLQLIHRTDLIESFRQQPDFAAGQLTEIFRSQTQAHWQQLGEANDICLTPVLNLEEALQHPQIQALGLAQPLPHPDFGPRALPVFPAGFGPDSTLPQRPMVAPEIGSHSRTICCDLLNVSADTYAKWLAVGVVAEP
jgi:crotonobetainyl-CoA:carnitine CoA-transferase CaiB-like acyl-CoA transferase